MDERVTSFPNTFTEAALRQPACFAVPHGLQDELTWIPGNEKKSHASTKNNTKSTKKAAKGGAQSRQAGLTQELLEAAKEEPVVGFSAELLKINLSDSSPSSKSLSPGSDLWENNDFEWWEEKREPEFCLHFPIHQSAKKGFSGFSLMASNTPSEASSSEYGGPATCLSLLFEDSSTE